MGEVMTQAIIGMPYDMAMSDELSRRQFHERAQYLLGEHEKLQAELATVKKVAYGNMELLEENAKLRAELERRVPAGFVLVPCEPTPEMVSAAEEAHMPCGDMDIALRMAILAAPSAPKADDRPLYTCIGKGGEYRYLGTAIGAGDSRGELAEVYQDRTGQLFHRTPEDFMGRMEPIAAAQEGGKV